MTSNTQKKVKKTFWNRYDQSEERIKEVPKTISEKADMCKRYLDRIDLELNYYLYQRSKRVRKTKLELQNNEVEEERSKVILKEVLNNETEFLRTRRTRIIVEDFITLAKIGQGSYGEVFLVKEKKYGSLTKTKLAQEKKKNKKYVDSEESETDSDETDSDETDSDETDSSETDSSSSDDEETKKSTGQVLALKRVLKSSIKTESQLKNIWTEREVLATLDSPWLVKLFASFQDEQYLYYVMDYHSGGDLKCLLREVGSLNEEATCFYLAEMILTVEDLHKQGFIHRDLKPENFLISSDGHLKLTDFGLSKNIFPDQKNWKDTLKKLSREEFNKKKHFTLVGTPNYMSPEILSKKGYDNSVDFWSLGCILYELLSGIPPFSGEEIEETLRNIIFYTKTLVPPTTEEDEEIIEEDAWDLITTLLDVPLKEEPDVFLQNLKLHPFFEDIDFENIRESTPPFIPQLENEMDISYFDTTYFEDFDGELKTVITNFKTPKSFSKKEINNKFVGFTFRRFDK
ncbi:cell cycle protein kinase dbf2-related [Anaeramoeba flamelloides]|uniref:non-specific serine/threonine protein kinase n=1 Tax=Anaeramoeba flamelloides TaxID=1746091 RepID=A0AAV7Z4U8_9EUKA|nr:cell cycle protein kinase dbf2-related [Anaeramoeba flamelloides]